MGEIKRKWGKVLAEGKGGAERERRKIRRGCVAVGRGEGFF